MVDVRSINSEIMYDMCKFGKRTEVKEFISHLHGRELKVADDHCAEEELYTAAKLRFSAFSSYGNLAPVLLQLWDFKDAVEAERKATSVCTFQHVLFHLCGLERIPSWQICGFRVVVEYNGLMDAIEYYQDRGHFKGIIDLLYQVLTFDHVHTAMFTELCACMTKYSIEKMMEHWKMWW